MIVDFLELLEDAASIFICIAVPLLFTGMLVFVGWVIYSVIQGCA